jgi:hypothetical protein
VNDSFSAETAAAGLTTANNDDLGIATSVAVAESWIALTNVGRQVRAG